LAKRKNNRGTSEATSATLGDEASRAKEVLGRVYDPCSGFSGMFVRSVEFIRAHSGAGGGTKRRNGNGGKARTDISIYGQESNDTTWRLAKINLAIRGIEGQIAHGDTFHNDRFPDLKADFIFVNPPFNVSDWGAARLRDDRRWQYGAAPEGNADSLQARVA
jgi:type I restriction enzyme M protein